MPPKQITFDTAREIGLALPDVEQGTAYGSPALMVRGKMFACIPVNKSAEAGSLAVRIDFVQRQDLLASDPDIFYVTDHYVNYPCVLVRLSRIRLNALRDLLQAARSFVLTNDTKPVRRRKSARPRK